MVETLPSRILVLGLGRSGEAVARYAAVERELGADVTVTAVDEAVDPTAVARARMFEDLGARVVLGADEAPGEWDLVVASPGIPPSSRLMRWALTLGVPVVSEVELAWRLSRCAWVAVTGTNGKTTTTALTAHLLAESGVPSEAVGNIGSPALAAVRDAGPASVLVAEVSSFQLSLTDTFHPRVAVLLNITADHVDWHGSLERYIADKARVFANLGPADLAVIDVDDEGSAPWAETIGGCDVPVCRVSRTQLYPGGAAVVDGVLTVDRPEGTVSLVEFASMPVRGQHNVSNALAAAAAALATGASPEGVRAGLLSFKPIEHRLEPVATVAGVEYYNDSKATNPDAVLKALTAFEDRSVVVLLGGRNKGNDFGELARAVSSRCRLAILFGESLPEMRGAFAGRDIGTIEVDHLAQAVEVAAREATSGDVVLFSPACASFDQFSSYEQRGQVFKALVSVLADVADEAS